MPDLDPPTASSGNPPSSPGKSEDDGVENLDELPVSDPWILPDHELTLLVDIVNTTDIEVGLRLQYQGGLLSGLLISGSRYFDILSDRFSSQSNTVDDVFAVLAEVYKSRAEHYREMRAKDANELGSGFKRTMYIHFREAAFFVPGSASLEVDLWRGRLVGVAGWAYGNYAV